MIGPGALGASDHLCLDSGETEDAKNKQVWQLEKPNINSTEGQMTRDSNDATERTGHSPSEQQAGLTECECVCVWRLSFDFSSKTSV